MKAERLPCLVPFCNKTTRKGVFIEWLCQLHWMRVDRRLRVVHRRRQREITKLELMGVDASHLREANRLTWEKIRTQALGDII